MQHPRRRILTAAGEREAVAPLIVSASRATDIPAFHGAWFMERLRAGYCLRRNPCNSRQVSVIALDSARVFVFWSKNPRPFLPHLREIAARGHAFYFQFTLNDYEAEGLEPHVPPLAQRIETFRRLADMYGPERVIWRFDPLLLGGGLDVPRLLDRIDALGRRLAPHTEKLVFSFLDMYRKTQLALRRHDLSLRAPDAAEMGQLAAGLRRLADSWPHSLRLASCAEDIGLEAFGIAHNACVDGELVRRLCPRDADVLRLCGSVPPAQLSLLPLAGACGTPGTPDGPLPRDSSQRTACRCLPSRDIGEYSTCRHGCLYCYANQSEAVVRARLSGLRPGRESLI